MLVAILQPVLEALSVVALNGRRHVGKEFGDGGIVLIFLHVDANPQGPVIGLCGLSSREEPDLKSREITVTMTHIKQEEVGKEKDLKYVLYFKEADRGLVLNKTVSAVIAGYFGIETAGWMGKQIILFPTTTEAFGEIKPCIRVKSVAMASQLVGSGTIDAAPGNGGLEPAAPSTPVFTETNPPPLTEEDAFKL